MKNNHKTFIQAILGNIATKVGIALFPLFFIFSLNSYAQLPWLIKDVNATGGQHKLSNGVVVGPNSSMLTNHGTSAASMYNVNGTVLFFGTDGTNTGIFKTDGTAPRTMLVSALPIGTSDQIYYAYNTGSILYFNLANSLYRSDGTANGTYKIFDAQTQAAQYGTINVSYTNNNLNYLAYYNGNFFFQASTATSWEVFETDGTLTGTKLLLNVSYPGFSTFLIQVFNNKLYYLNSPSYIQPGNPDVQLFSYNLSTGSTNMEYDFSTAGNDSTGVYQMVNLNNKYLVLNGMFSGINQVISISSTGSAPTILLNNLPDLPRAPGETAPGADLLYSDNAANTIISGGKLFFTVVTGTYFGSSRTYATDGTPAGTNSLGFDDSPLTHNYLGTTNTGMIFQERQQLGTQNVYIWNGQSSNSYKLLQAVSDSVNVSSSAELTSAVQIKDKILLIPSAFDNYILLTDTLGSYCYEVMDNLNAVGWANSIGAVLNNSYICFASNTLSLGRDLFTGDEPYIFSPDSWSVWMGKVSADWNNSGNWLNNTVPDTSKEAIIPDGVISPILSSGGFCKDLYVFANDQSNGETPSVANVTINKPASLSVSRNLLNAGYITGSGSLNITGNGSSQVSVYDCSYNYDGRSPISPLNVDTINIKGANLDITDIYPDVTISSVINFESDNQLVANYSNLAFDKKPFFIGYNSKRFIITNRYSSINTGNDIAQSAADSISTIPIGTNINSYTPVSEYYTYGSNFPITPNTDYGFKVALRDTVYSQGITGTPLTTNIVNKVWVTGSIGTALKFSWQAGDQTSGFIPSNCTVETVNKNVWMPSTFQNAIPQSDIYSATFKNPQANNNGLFLANTNGLFAVFSKPIAMPAVQDSALTITALKPRSATVNWRKGNASARVVFISTDTTGKPGPVNNTNYVSNNSYGAGSQIGSTGWYCVYNGLDSTVNITGLNPVTSYRVMTIGYNGFGGLENYETVTSAGNPDDFKTPPSSSIATLNSLSFNGGYGFQEFFIPDSTNYDATVNNSSATISLTPTLTDTSATIKINGVTQLNGQAGTAIPLKVGNNIIKVVVTAQDSITIKTYTLSIARRGLSTDVNLSNLVISSGTLTPAFAPGISSYTDSVGYASPSITVTPTLSESTAAVSVNGQILASGNASAAIPLNVGSINQIVIAVASQDSLSFQNYYLNVTRAPSTNANLANLSLSSGTLTPVFATGTNIYTASVANAVSSITITPTLSDSTATIKINGAVLPKVGPSQAISLNVGDNAITVTVTAQDGVTTQTYTVNVIRELFTLPSNNFQLAITSATCRGNSDGSVTITAADTLNYTATITGNGLNNPYPFKNSVNINNLAAGTYSVCMTVAGQSNYQQCYSVVITQPADLSVYTTVNSAANSVTLALNGGTQYNIQLNGELYTTTGSSFTLPLTEGNNTLTVTTDRLCQGTIQRTINISGKIIPYPVPFQTTLNLNLGNTNINNVSVEIHNVRNGALVYANKYTNQAGVLQLDLNQLGSGVYALHLSMDNSEKIFKIIKK